MIVPTDNPIAARALRVLIPIVGVIILLNFLSGHLDLPIPAPGKRINNPFAALLIFIFLRGMVDPPFRENQLSLLHQILMTPSRLFFLFGGLLGFEIFLEIMHFMFPDTVMWNLDRERSLGTYFSTAQLFLVGLVVLLASAEDEDVRAGNRYALWTWRGVAFVYFYIGIDDCIGIHERINIYMEMVAPDASGFHSIHEWLWFYIPVALAVAAALLRFFALKFLREPLVLGILITGLILWINVLLMESVAKSLAVEIGYDLSKRFFDYLVVGLEEGCEMLGATLYLLGFSLYLRKKKLLRGEAYASADSSAP